MPHRRSVTRLRPTYASARLAVQVSPDCFLLCPEDTVESIRATFGGATIWKWVSDHPLFPDGTWLQVQDP